MSAKRMPSAKRRVDYSRMVNLDLTPTEACALIVLLEGILEASEKAGEIDEYETARNTVREWIAHLTLQLDQLDWPAERRRAPFPV